MAAAAQVRPVVQEPAGLFVRAAHEVVRVMARLPAAPRAPRLPGAHDQRPESVRFLDVVAEPLKPGGHPIPHTKTPAADPLPRLLLLLLGLRLREHKDHSGASASSPSAARTRLFSRSTCASTASSRRGTPAKSSIAWSTVGSGRLRSIQRPRRANSALLISRSVPAFERNVAQTARA